MMPHNSLRIAICMPIHILFPAVLNLRLNLETRNIQQQNTNPQQSKGRAKYKKTPRPPIRDDRKRKK
jgi:hypothetical protein